MIVVQSDLRVRSGILPPEMLVATYSQHILELQMQHVDIDPCRKLLPALMGNVCVCCGRPATKSGSPSLRVLQGPFGRFGRLQVVVQQVLGQPLSLPRRGVVSDLRVRSDIRNATKNACTNVFTAHGRSYCKCSVSTK